VAAVVGRVVATGVGAIVSVPAWTTIGAVAVVDARVAMPGGAPAVIGARGSAAGPRGRKVAAAAIDVAASRRAGGDVAGVGRWWS
jgi:hypothetical protein